ncbi:hypothetical protein QBC34DRAFT_224725 [Podospora aff. communis PSN243]|uniref:Uncharacterized protein n=1 Tax=Podospora aff. communis PSN243 TaxID=3040156 RepID=A0AAV9G3R4_9PEZI|nr:hypothetical protein QBC34DRAFT_224725 [Podospora aff. communis PSN243]
MAEAPNISYAGSSAVATAVRVTTILTTAIQAIGDAPDDVRRVLNRVQEVRAAILRLPNPMQLSPATIGAQWPRDWLTEAHRAIDATAAETGGLHMRLSDWDQRRSARQIRMTWEAFHVVIPSGLLDTASRRIESAKTAIEILISAVDLTSTPDITAQIERTRTIISNLLTDQQVVEAPVPHEPPPPYSSHVGPNGNVPNRRGTPGFNNSVGYVLVQYPNGTVGAAAAPQFVHGHGHQSFPVPARRRSSEQLGYFQNPTPAATPVDSSTTQTNPELVTLKQEAATLRQEAAALRQEVATLREEAAALREEAIALKQENATLKREAIVLKQDMATLKEEAATLKEEAAALKQEAAALKQESATKDVKISELAVEITTLKNRRDSVLAVNTDPQDDILQRVISKYKNVKRLYFDSQKDIVELKKQVEELKKLEHAAESKDLVIEKWKEEYEKLQKQVQSQEEADGEIAETKEKYEALVGEQRSVLETMAKSLEDMQGERDRLALELQAAKDGLRSHEAELAATKSILANTQRLLDERENRLANSDDTRTELEHRLEGQSRRLEEVEHERATVYDFVRRLSQLGLDASRFLDESHSAAASS